MSKMHHYSITTRWTGNSGTGTSSYKGYERSLVIAAKNKTDIHATSDTAFNSDPTKHNPEELLLAAISSCHMLWYLHLCANAGVVVLEYSDDAKATMTETADGGGHFTEAVLYPAVLVQSQEMAGKAIELHRAASKLCYIANSCNFPIHHQPTVSVKS